MVLAEALRARLLAALRPWLVELRVEPGLLSRSRAAAGEPAPWPATIDRAAAAEVELAASPWAAPAVDVVVRGVDVALTRGRRRRPSLLGRNPRGSNSSARFWRTGPTRICCEYSISERLQPPPFSIQTLEKKVRSDLVGAIHSTKQTVRDALILPSLSDTKEPFHFWTIQIV